MRPYNKFLINHQIKLSWKYLKHGVGVLLMTDEHPADPKNLQTHNMHKDHNVFMDYLELTDVF